MKIDVEKLLKNSIKIAAVLLTSPATLSVAGNLYADQPVYRLIVQCAALTLIEGALILGWWQLDNDRKAELPQRFLYAGLSCTAYLGLWVIALSHGEGMAGIVFRATLGVLLFYSVFESGILASIRLKNRVERDASRHREVRRYRTKAEIQVAKLEIDIWKTTETDRLQKQSDVYSRELSIEHRTALQAIAASDSKNATLSRGNYPYPIEKVNGKKKLSKSEKLESFLQYIDSTPGQRPVDYVEWARDNLQIADSTAWKYWIELKQNGHKVIETDPAA